MQTCEVYKLKEGANIRGSFYRNFYIFNYFQRLLTDGEATKNTELVIIGIDPETLEMAQLMDKYVVTMEIFNSLFEEEPAIGQSELMERFRKMRELDEQGMLNKL